MSFCHHIIRIFKQIIFFIGRRLIILICYIGLFYQSIQILIEYCSGSTIAKIDIGTYSTETLPSFTICLPQYLQISRAATYDDELNRLYTNYSESLEKIYRDNGGLFIIDSQEMMDIAEKYYRFNNIIDYLSVPAYEILTNYSLVLGKR